MGTRGGTGVLSECAHLALKRSVRLLDSSTAAPPTRNRQLGISMDLWLPTYQFCTTMPVFSLEARACLGNDQPEQ